MEDTAGFESNVFVSTVSYGSYLNILKCQKVSPDAQNGNAVVALKPAQRSWKTDFAHRIELNSASENISNIAFKLNSSYFTSEIKWKTLLQCNMKLSQLFPKAFVMNNRHMGRLVFAKLFYRYFREHPCKCTWGSKLHRKNTSHTNLFWLVSSYKHSKGIIITAIYCDPCTVNHEFLTCGIYVH